MLSVGNKKVDHVEIADIIDFTLAFISMTLGCYLALRYGWRIIDPFYFWRNTDKLEKGIFFLVGFIMFLDILLSKLL